MFVSLRWLARHVDLEGLTAEEVGEGLTIHTAEVERIERFAPWLSDVVVGHVIACDRHPDADRLSLCRVDLGDGEEPLQIVCGAPNVGEGQKVAVGRVGTVLAEDLKLKKAKIRGVESHGMICSERELGLGDEHAGIWVLSPHVQVGQPLAAALGVEDWVLEIDNKSLTHRPDLWGHRGIAREIAAIHGRELKPLPLALPETAPGEPYPVRVETEGCSRYIGLAIADVRVERSPDWLRFLLLAAGQRPLDLLVDISNFVMLDLGQPNHLFDLNRLSSEGIVVRDAREGETMATLDEVERTFTSADMLICSGDEPVAIAGLMGGEGSSVSSDTNELLLEVASFHPTRVRRTSARLGLRTDASTRFEKHLDPTLPAQAAAHLVNTLRQIQPDLRLPRPLGDAGRWQDPARTVSLRPARLRAVLGASVSDGEIEEHLTRLGFGVARGEVWDVAVPSARATKDIQIEEDLIEEVGRMCGYDRIAEQAMVGQIRPPAPDARRELVQGLFERLAGAARFHEAMTYSFHDRELVDVFGIADEPHVRIVNPQIETLDRVRRSVLPSLLAHLEHNLRHHAEVRLFEIGKGYRPEDGNDRGEPGEVHQVAIVWAAPRPSREARFDANAFHRLQGVVEDLLQHVGRRIARWARIEPSDAPAWAHPGRCVGAYAGPADEHVATLSALEPRIQRRLGLVGELDCEVACAELSIDRLMTVAVESSPCRPIRRFPGIKVDVALAVPEELGAGEVARAIEQAGKGLVATLELFDLYRGESVGAGRKSLAYHVLLRAADRTLSDQDGAKFLARLERAMTELHGELRKE